MLKKFEHSPETTAFKPGVAIFVVARNGKILDGFRITKRLADLVELDRSPLEEIESKRGCQNAKHQPATADSKAHGFTVVGQVLKPNWCEGKRFLLGACLTKEEAELLAASHKTKEALT